MSELAEALSAIRQQDALMRKCLDSKNRVMDALKHASTLLAELRTSRVLPKSYYELYIAVFDSLSVLGQHLRRSHPTHHLADMYELVQYAGNIIPRLYLMLTVGTVYMSVDEAPIKEIMKDMMEMCRGVQHPIRGLFLRYYLTQGAREHLPLGTSNGPEGNLQDSIQFILTNFIEMNKLWVRLQHQGHSRDREKRYHEREELQDLVGSNLVRLSQLEGIDREMYREEILPAILEQVVQCRDKLAQEYLLDVISQVFPDEFHLYTLDLFLSASLNLHPQASLRKIVVSLINRLATFAKSSPVDISTLMISEAQIDNSPVEHDADENEPINKSSIVVDDLVAKHLSRPEEAEGKGEPEAQHAEDDDVSQKSEHVNGEKPEESVEADVSKTTQTKEESSTQANDAGEVDNIFEIFWDYLRTVNEEKPEVSLQERVEIAVDLSKLSLAVYPENAEYIDRLGNFIKSQSSFNATSIAAIKDFLLSTMAHFPKLLTVLTIPSYGEVLEAQPAATQKSVAEAVVASVFNSESKISTVEDAEGVFGLLEVLIKADGESEIVPGGTSQGKTVTTGQNDISPEIEAEQSKLTRIVHLLFSEDISVHFELLNIARKHLSKSPHKRLVYPSLIYGGIALVSRYCEKKESPAAIFKFVDRLIGELQVNGMSELALRLYVMAASAADQVNQEEVSYEFYAQAFTVYEESLSDSRSQFQAICVIAGSLQMTRNFSTDNYDTLVSKCALYGSKLLKKADQCRAVYLASHLWWATELPGEEEGSVNLYKDDKRVLECLQRALRVADACMDVSVATELFVEILNRFLYFYDRGNSEITVKYITNLINLIQTNISNSEDLSDSARQHFKRTIAYIEKQKDVDERWQEIEWW